MLGCSYYPETGNPNDWDNDLGQMASAGMQIVRVGEFAWSRLEPKEGDFHMDWLVAFLDRACGNSLKVVLATPTAAPPRWMQSCYPDTVAMGPDGRRLPPGSRKCGNPASRRLRDFSLRVVTRLVESCGSHPAVAVWQLDNEPGAWGSTRSFCTEAEEHYRNWLESRYQTIGALNRAWQAVHWSQELTDWSETALLRPRGTPRHGAAVNHEEWIDNMRFVSDLTIDFLKVQRDAIKNLIPAAKTTTNLCPIHDCGIDFHKLAREVDFCSWDNYSLNWLEAAFHHDIVRNLHPDCADFWVMEQRCGAVDSRDINPPPCPGEVEKQVRQNHARGAGATLFFPWKPFSGGAEVQHEAVCGGDGRLRPDLEPEVRSVSCHPPDRLNGGRVAAEIAIVWDMENWWAVSGGGDLRIKRRHNRLDYRAVLMAWHHLFTRRGVTVDMVPQDGNFEGYRLVVIPCLPRVGDGLFPRLEAFVSRGGTVCATALFGTANGGLVGAWSSFFGVSAPRWACLADNRQIVMQGTGIEEEGEWVIHPSELREASQEAVFPELPQPCHCALSRRRLGKGQAVFCSVLVPRPGDCLARWLWATAGLEPVGDLPPETENVRWRNPEGEVEWIQIPHPRRSLS